MPVRAHEFAAVVSLAAAIAGCGAAEPPAHLRIEGGEPKEGRQLIINYGCGTCHTIEGVPGAIGMVGPPLTDFAQRKVLAGSYPNVPRHLVRWLMNPPALQPETAMPSLGLSAEQAGHIATYLYTLGAEDTDTYEVRPTASHYPWLDEAEAYREAERRRLSETERVGPQRARIPIERAMELLATMPETSR